MNLPLVTFAPSPDLIDSIELERTVANLNKELMASCQVETALRAQLDELAVCQTLPDKVDALVKQVRPKYPLKPI